VGHSAATARLEAGARATEGKSAGSGTQLILALDKAHYHALFIALHHTALWRISGLNASFLLKLEEYVTEALNDQCSPGDAEPFGSLGEPVGNRCVEANHDCHLLAAPRRWEVTFTMS
jgi:hypothetical protein